MPKRLFNNGRWRDTLAWVLIVGVIAFSVIRTQHTNDEIKRTQEQQAIDRCQSSQELRSAIRANIKSVYQLAIAAVTPPETPSTEPTPPPTPEERAAMKRYLATARDFRDNALAKVPPVSPGCEDFVQQKKEDNQ
jgi:hypothetical protein